MNIYQTLYDLVNQYVFNNEIVANSPQELATTLFCLGATLFLLSMPFIIVFYVMRFLIGFIR